MKKISFIILSFSFAIANAQVIIGDAVGTAAVKTSVLLEFAKGSPTGNRGIVLPYVTTLPTSPTEGTLLLDCSTAATARVKFYNANPTPGTYGWTDMSGQNSNVSSALTIQNTATESTAARAIIGTVPNPIPPSFPEGILVLNSTTKAMVLPHVASVQDIAQPAPGMMVYVTGVAPNFNKRFAVFNGSKWSFWKP
ncbi:MAG TPA: hypothetical protein DIS75_03835 [Chryseobacterium sp.]|nr:hypothetical protein [Chryseobacterium sp.]